MNFEVESLAELFKTFGQHVDDIVKRLRRQALITETFNALLDAKSGDARAALMDLPNEQLREFASAGRRLNDLCTEMLADRKADQT